MENSRKVILKQIEIDEAQNEVQKDKEKFVQQNRSKSRSENKNVNRNLLPEFNANECIVDDDVQSGSKEQVNPIMTAVHDDLDRFDDGINIKVEAEELEVDKFVEDQVGQKRLVNKTSDEVVDYGKILQADKVKGKSDMEDEEHLVSNPRFRQLIKDLFNESMHEVVSVHGGLTGVA